MKAFSILCGQNVVFLTTAGVAYIKHYAIKGYIVIYAYMWIFMEINI
jgi:hypothetical protein